MPPSLFLAFSLGVGCAPDAVPEPAPDAPPVEPVAAPATPTLRRLTQDQYANSVTDVLGAGLILPSQLEPDTATSGLRAVGASVTSVSPLGVEQYEDAALSLAEQALDEAHRAAIVPCTPNDVVDAACADTVVRTLGRKAWRRALTDEEAARLVALAGTASGTLGDFHDGLVYAVAALLQSPNFLYRVELGEDDPDEPGQRRFTSIEMATRLSYLFWNTTPDEELLAAGERGELVTEEGLEAQVARLMADPRSAQGIRAFFDDMLMLYTLDDLSKDPSVFTLASATLGPAAREETLLGLEAIVLQDDADYRQLFTSQRTFLDRELATLYEVRAPSRDGFGEAWLDEAGGRRGLLGQAAFLASNAHAVSSSATKRGVFVREVLLCQPMPAPPADVNTAIPEPTEDAVTLRDRVEIHLTDPSCASCHKFTDPIGLGLENFDGLGGWRLLENGATIDPSGELDGVSFADAWQLGQVLHDHERTGPCLTQTLFSYAVGHAVAESEEPSVDYLSETFSLAAFSVKTLLAELATSRSFRAAGEVE